MALKKVPELKLKIELVPETSWYENLRKKMRKKDWDNLRHEVYTKYINRCGICDASGRLNCHEIWEYDDQNNIQKLKGFIALCDMCHHVKHFGLAQILANEGKLDLDQVIQYFMNVNNCSISVFNKHRRESFEQWRERSSHKWQIDLGEYQNLFEPIATN
ncbi:MAG TPA: HNH endonuclease [Dehalococcoidales bacterium]